MKRFGLIGHPIGHSLSPALFKAAYGGRYDYELIEGAVFEESYTRFLDSYDAINVTAPFKEPACSKADRLSPECEILGACNVLKKTEEGILAANTDYLGVMKCLLPYHTALSLKPLTLVVGCGGAGKAAAYAACELGNEVIIINRTFSKAAAFAEKLTGHNSLYRISARPLKEFCRWFRMAGTIIYTLPCPVEELGLLKKSDIKGKIFGCTEKVIMEASYKAPSFSQSLKESMSAINPKTFFICGQQWLLYQAAEAYSIFTADEPNIPEMLKVL